jgi:uncharacterized protein (DUF488 family)
VSTIETADNRLIWTIGHSTRKQEEFLGLLKSHAIGRLIDIRTVPRSRTNPQFNLDVLTAVLHDHGIAYTHLGSLGGLRHPQKESVNTGWRNTSFRGFADYMRTEEFALGLGYVIEISRVETACLMCAEIVPWRCHRSLIADALTVRDTPVTHIINGTSSYPHRLTPWAKVAGEKITYPPSAPEAPD